MLVVAAVTMGAAVLGPVYARAAGESTLRETLTGAGAAAGLRLQDVPFAYELQQPVSREDFEQAQAKALAPGALRGYPTRIGSIYVPGAASVPSGSGVKTGLLWRQDACAHLRIVTGHCPDGPDQALVSQRSINGGYGFKPGVPLQFSPAQGGTSGKPGPVITLRIVGAYAPKDATAPYWAGQDYFNAAPSFSGPDTVDTVFVTASEFFTLPAETQAKTQGILAWDYPLDPAAIRLDDVAQLRHDVAALRERLDKVPDDSYVKLVVSTKLNRVLDSAAHQRHQVDVATLLVSLQLGLLAWLVLYEVVTDHVESRGSEIALAKLRGLRPWWTVRFALGEPLALLLIAAPVGLGLGWLAAWLFASVALVEGTPVALTWYTAAGLGAGFAGALLAAAAASWRVLRRSVLAQWRRTHARARRSTRAGLVLDVAVSLAAVAGLVVLLHTSHGSGAGQNTAALLAPALLVLAVALLGTRLLPVATRVLLKPTRRSGWIGLFLAARHVVRRPAGLRLAALLTVAVGLATFGVSGEAVAAANRSARARAEVGAHRVVTVQYEAGVDPLAAVRKADPHSKWAMPAATWLPDGGDSVLGTVLAVDPSRLPAAGYSAAGGPSMKQIAATIGASTFPTITITATRIRARVTTNSLHGPAPQLQFRFRTPHDPQLTVTAGTLRPGTHDYTADLHCADGCTLLGLAWDRPVSATFATMRATLTVHRLQTYRHGTWSRLPAALNRKGGWRAGPEVSESSDTLRAAPDGLHDQLRSSSGHGVITYASTPSPLPVIATPAAVVTGPQAPTALKMVDGFDTTATFTVKRWARVLPSVLADGLIVDVRFLREQLPDFANEAQWSIWLGPGAPPNALAKLRNAGLTLQHNTTTHARTVQLGRQPPALALFLLLACAIIGAAVGVGGTAIAVAATARRRSFETAALRVIGVPRRALYRGGVLEQILLLGAAAVLGVPAGAVAAWLAMPVIPEFSTPTPILLHYTPPAAPIIGCAVGFVVLVCLAAAMAARAVLRQARPTRLREAEE